MKHILAPLYFLFTLFGCGGGGVPRGLGQHLLRQFFSLGGSKMELSKNDFFATRAMQNVQISCIEHVLAPLHVFFRPFVVYLHVVGLPS